MGWGGWVNYLQRSMIFYAYICIYVYMYIGTHLYIYMCRYGDMYMCIDVSCSRVVPHEVIWSHLFPSQDPRWSHPRKSIVLVKNPGGLLQGSRGAGGRGQGLRDLRASEKWQMRRWGRLDNATQESRKCSKEPSNNQEDRKSAAISAAAEAWFATNFFLKMCTSLRPKAHFYAKW